MVGGKVVGHGLDFGRDPIRPPIEFRAERGRDRLDPAPADIAAHGERSAAEDDVRRMDDEFPAGEIDDLGERRLGARLDGHVVGPVCAEGSDVRCPTAVTVDEVAGALWCATIGGGKLCFETAGLGGKVRAAADRKVERAMPARSAELGKDRVGGVFGKGSERRPFAADHAELRHRALDPLDEVAA